MFLVVAKAAMYRSPSPQGHLSNFSCIPCDGSTARIRFSTGRIQSPGRLSWCQINTGQTRVISLGHLLMHYRPSFTVIDEYWACTWTGGGHGYSQGIRGPAGHPLSRDIGQELDERRAGVHHHGGGDQGAHGIGTRPASLVRGQAQSGGAEGGIWRWVQLLEASLYPCGVVGSQSILGPPVRPSLAKRSCKVGLSRPSLAKWSCKVGK